MTPLLERVDEVDFTGERTALHHPPPHRHAQRVESIRTYGCDISLNFRFVQDNEFIISVLERSVNITQNFVKCVIAQLTVLNVSVLDHVFKGLCNRLVHCFLSSMVRAVTESLWRTKVAATFMTTLLQRANPRLESILKIEVAERRDIFGVDGV